MPKYEVYHRNIKTPQTWEVWEAIDIVDLQEKIRSYCCDEYWVYDCDGGSDVKYSFAYIVDGEVFYVDIEHSFYENWVADGEDEEDIFEVMNSFEIEFPGTPFEHPSPINHPSKKRDWLTFSYNKFKETRI